MENIFRKTFTITAAHSDCFGRAKPSALLYFSQEAAGGHCKLLEVDYDTLKEKGLFWAVIRSRVQVTKLPTLGQTITVETWPMPTTRSSFPRSTVAYDENGQELFRQISLWVLMDANSRSMVLPAKSQVLVEGACRGTELAAPGSIVPKPMENTTLRQVGYTELDRNLHMNNTRYLDWIDDLLPAEFHKNHPLRDLTICYLNEATQGQKINLNWQLGDGPCLQVEGCRQAENDCSRQERVFAAILSF